jgi:hypothetical protein
MAANVPIVPLWSSIVDEGSFCINAPFDVFDRVRTKSAQCVRERAARPHPAHVYAIALNRPHKRQFPAR